MIMLTLHVTSERQRRVTNDTDADARRSRDRDGAEGRDDAERRRDRAEPTQRRGRDAEQG